MKLVALRSERDRISGLFHLLNADAGKVDIKTLSVFSQFMAVKSAGFVELSVQLTFEEYAKNRSNTEISKFLLYSAGRLNSVNCEKIEIFLGRFNSSWWSKIVTSVDQEHLDAIDSLKTIRDQVAHGKHNGTGLNRIQDYFKSAIIFSTEFQKIILS